MKRFSNLLVCGLKELNKNSFQHFLLLGKSCYFSKEMELIDKQLLKNPLLELLFLNKSALLKGEINKIIKNLPPKFFLPKNTTSEQKSTLPVEVTKNSPLTFYLPNKSLLKKKENSKRSSPNSEPLYHSVFLEDDYVRSPCVFTIATSEIVRF